MQRMHGEELVGRGKPGGPCGLGGRGGKGENQVRLNTVSGYEAFPREITSGHSVPHIRTSAFYSSVLFACDLRNQTLLLPLPPSPTPKAGLLGVMDGWRTI